VSHENKLLKATSVTERDLHSWFSGGVGKAIISVTGK